MVFMIVFEIHCNFNIALQIYLLLISNDFFLFCQAKFARPKNPVCLTGLARSVRVAPDRSVAQRQMTI